MIAFGNTQFRIANVGARSTVKRAFFCRGAFRKRVCEREFVRNTTTSLEVHSERERAREKEREGGGAGGRERERKGEGAGGGRESSQSTKSRQTLSILSNTNILWELSHVLKICK